MVQDTTLQIYFVIGDPSPYSDPNKINQLNRLRFKSCILHFLLV